MTPGPYGNPFQLAYTVIPFNWHIGVIHRSKTDRAQYPLTGQDILEQLNSIGFHPNLGQIPQLVAFRPRITINALVLAAAVQIHVVLQAKPGIRLLNMIEDGLGCDLCDHVYHLG